MTLRIGGGVRSVQTRNTPDIDDGDASGYAASYYPGTPNPGEAQRVTLGVGQEMSIEMPMAQVRLARISGTAVVSQRVPLRGGPTT